MSDSTSMARNLNAVTDGRDNALNCCPCLFRAARCRNSYHLHLRVADRIEGRRAGIARNP